MTTERFFDRYIQLVSADKSTIALQTSLDILKELDLDLLNAIGEKTYAPNKWSIKDILQHLIDTERIMSYRALRFARNDNTLLSTFDENEYAKAALANRRNVEEILHELINLRKSNIALFNSFDENMLARTGISFHQELKVEELAYVIAGHQFHHLKVMREKYYPLAVLN